MAYQALYRVWRPQTFDQLIGQEIVAETLKNAVAYQQLSHAYLFTGPRGTGKTSTARLLAKTINCLNQVEGNPCNQCESCIAIQSGDSPDVVEIDAASNNGVDEIRDLRDKVRYVPVISKYKVYIIDEVHMLTVGAFNALLKTLEEPPSHAIFVLATTEPHKIPATVISRTQRFDFHKIQESIIVNHLAHILTEMEVQYDPSALKILALAANGGMRDALSLLDQALSYDRTRVSEASALRVSGSFDQTVFKEYLLDLYLSEGFRAMELVQLAIQEGKQASRFIEELIIFAKDILLLQYTRQNQSLLSQADIQKLEKIPKQFYFSLIDHLIRVQDQFRLSHQPDLYLQVVTLQLVQLKEGLASVENNQLEGRIAELEAQVQDLSDKLEAVITKGVSTATFEEGKEARMRPVSAGRRHAYRQERNQIFAVLDQATRAHLERMKQEWLGILSQLNPKERSKFAETQPLAAGPGLVLIAFQNEIFCGMAQEDLPLIQKLMQISQNHLNEQVYYVFVLNREWHQLRRDYKLLRDQNAGKPLGIAFEVPEGLETSGRQANELPEEVEVLSQIEVEGIVTKEDIVLDSLIDETRESETVSFLPQEEVMALEQSSEEDKEVNSLPAHVITAIELFGKENIEIYE